MGGGSNRDGAGRHPIFGTIERCCITSVNCSRNLAGTAAAFLYEHALVRPDDLSKVNRAFFTVNGVVGIWLFGWALADLVLRGLHS